MKKNHTYYMSLAIGEAKKGLGFTSPNPLVGALIVKDDKIISTGYHKYSGGDHAEVDAIKKAGITEVRGSTLYVNLEPCCHYGKTPPCADLIVNSGFKEVVIACIDPDTRVMGKGIEVLKKAGIKVTTGVLEENAKRLNWIYFFYKKNNRPYILLKSALTLDGKIATSQFHSKWISSENCRNVVQRLRLRFKSIAVGKNTVMIDNPGLNCRITGYENKPVDRLIFSNTSDEKLLERFKNFPGRNFIIDKSISESAKSFIDFCVGNEIDSVLLEGGSHVYTWFLKNDLIDGMFLFYRPAFLGNDGIQIYNGNGILNIGELKDFKIVRTRIIDNNLLIKMKRSARSCSLES